MVKVNEELRLLLEEKERILARPHSGYAEDARALYFELQDIDEKIAKLESKDPKQAWKFM